MEVKIVGVGNVASLFSARAFVWGDVDPHDGGLLAVIVLVVVKLRFDGCVDRAVGIGV